MIASWIHSISLKEIPHAPCCEAQPFLDPTPTHHSPLFGGRTLRCLFWDYPAIVAFFSFFARVYRESRVIPGDAVTLKGFLNVHCATRVLTPFPMFLLDASHGSFNDAPKPSLCTSVGTRGLIKPVDGMLKAKDPIRPPHRPKSRRG